MNIVENLKDLQQREVITKSRFVYILGYKIFYMLKKIFLVNKVKGCFFSLYSYGVKFNLRFDKMEEFEYVKPIVEDFLNKNKSLIDNPGSYHLTTGIIPSLPEEVVVDYIGCYSFKWMIQIKDKFYKCIPDSDILGKYILEKKAEIEEDIINGEIFRDSKKVPLNSDYKSNIWERFVHLLSNAYPISYTEESNLFHYLKTNGINIYLNPNIVIF